MSPPIAPLPPHARTAQSSSPPVARWVWITSVVVLAALAAMIVPMARMFHARTRQADAIADALHAKMRADDLTGIFAASDPAYQQQVGRAKSDKLFKLIHDRMGDPGKASLAGFNFNTTTEGTLLKLTFNTHFAKGEGYETIDLRKTGGDYKLLGYHVNSPLLDGIHLDDKPAENDPSAN